MSTDQKKLPIMPRLAKIAEIENQNLLSQRTPVRLPSLAQVAQGGTEHGGKAMVYRRSGNIAKNTNWQRSLKLKGKGLPVIYTDKH
jgi:hypothetical protein